MANIKKASGNGASTTLSSSMSDSATAAPLTSDTNFSAKAGEGMVIIGEETATPEFAYASGKSGSSLTVPLANRGLEGGSAVGHAAGETVKGIITAGMWNDFTDAYEVEHNDDGTHKAATVTTLKATSAEITTGTVDTKLVTPKGLKDAGIVATGIAKATGAEIITGTDDAKYATPKAIKDSGITVTKTIMIQIYEGGVPLSTGDGKAYFTIPASLNGMNLTAVHARVIVAGTTGTTDIQIANVTDSVDMLSTKLTIDSTETGSDTATAAVIDTTKDDVATNDLLRIDIDAVSTTAPKGLIVRLVFSL